MFHTRQAMDRRDKVFALLGMCSDNPEEAGLQPNYDTFWEEIFEQVVKFILGKDLSVKTSSQTARIKCKAIVIGQISEVTRDNRQHINFRTKFKDHELGDTIGWTLQASANPIQKHDVICLLYGASNPSIIRLCKDHFTIVVIAATPLDKTSYFEWPKLSQSKTQLLRNFLLVWDWESSCGNIQDGEEYETLKKTFSQVLEFSRAEPRLHFEKEIAVWNDIAILDDMGEYGEASSRLVTAQTEYYSAFGKAPSLWVSNNEYGRKILGFAAGEGHEDVVKLLLDTIHPDIKDGQDGKTPLLLAVKNRHEIVVKILLATGQFDAECKYYSIGILLLQAARNRDEVIMKLLLAFGQVDADPKK
ncbi:hypothetical protein EAE96_008793 [Botrytis aclada]|nr:hypothetical protein EAE96_008793 [Botrytis aclada]